MWLASHPLHNKSGKPDLHVYIWQVFLFGAICGLNTIRENMRQQKYSFEYTTSNKG